MKSFCFAMVGTLISVGFAHAQITPITVTGFQIDNVYSGSGDSVAADNNGFEFFSGAGNGGGNTSSGLVADGAITSDYNSNTTFQLAPYTGDNLAQAINGGSVTLSLATPASYSTLAFLVTDVGNGGATFTLNFSDGSSASSSVAYIPYWVNGPGESHEAYFSTPLIDNGSPIDFYEYDVNVPTADLAKTLNSVTFTSVQTIDPTNGPDYENLNVFAVSGAVPEPSTWAMLLGGLGVVAFVSRVGRKLRA